LIINPLCPIGHLPLIRGAKIILPLLKNAKTILPLIRRTKITPPLIRGGRGGLKLKQNSNPKLSIKSFLSDYQKQKQILLFQRIIFISSKIKYILNTN
jgi:hypothetical protein